MNHFSRLAIAGAVFAFASIAAQAQTMRVSIPFRFHAGASIMPAGEYQVTINQQSRHLTIAGLDNHAGCFLNYKTAMLGKDAVKGRLVFHAYGSAHFLNRVEPRSSDGVELFTSRAERELARVNFPEVSTVSEGLE